MPEKYMHAIVITCSGPRCEWQDVELYPPVEYGNRAGEMVRAAARKALQARMEADGWEIETERSLWCPQHAQKG